MASVIIDDGGEIIGEVVSTTVIVWVAEAELPEESVAVQVTMVSPSGKTSGASFVMEITPTSSEDSGMVNSVLFWSRLVASNTISSTNAIRGEIVSINWIDWLSVDTLPTTSVAVQVTMVSPSGKTSGASFVMEITPTSSIISGISKETRLRSGDFASNEMFFKGEIFGDVVSWMVTVWEAIAMFPAPSTAVQIMVFIPNGKDSGALFVRE